MDFSIAIDRDVGHAQIDTQDTLHIDRVRRFDLGSREQIPLPTHEG
jgi:hypothetical protein